jgi:lysine 2,3-aminomutase
MRGHTTGYAIPQYVIDAPGGGGKIPLNPNYIKEITDNELVLKNFKGEEYIYPLHPSPNRKRQNLENPLNVVRC